MLPMNSVPGHGGGKAGSYMPSNEYFDVHDAPAAVPSGKSPVDGQWIRWRTANASFILTSNECSESSPAMYDRSWWRRPINA